MRGVNLHPVKARVERLAAGYLDARGSESIVFHCQMANTCGSSGVTTTIRAVSSFYTVRQWTSKPDRRCLERASSSRIAMRTSTGDAWLGADRCRCLRGQRMLTNEISMSPARFLSGSAYQLELTHSRPRNACAPVCLLYQRDQSVSRGALTVRICWKKRWVLRLPQRLACVPWSCGWL